MQSEGVSGLVCGPTTICSGSGHPLAPRRSYPTQAAWKRRCTSRVVNLPEHEPADWVVMRLIHGQGGLRHLVELALRCSAVSAVQTSPWSYRYFSHSTPGSGLLPPHSTWRLSTYIITTALQRLLSYSSEGSINKHSPTLGGGSPRGISALIH